MSAVPRALAAPARPAAPLLVRALRRVGDAWRGLIIGVPTVWLVLFFLVPFLIVLKISLAQSIVGRPPYSALLEWGEGAWPAITASLRNYVFLTQDWLYLAGYLNSVKIALISTALCLVCGYPIAYGIARSSPRRAQHPAAVRDPAVLDLVPAAHLCLDGDPQQAGHPQRCPGLERHPRPSRSR